jgi:type IV pilus assembly protein PilW
MELMVGMTIGMIATIIIVQVMSVFEAQKRTTTGTADAQTNGGIALYSIAREAQNAGYPLFPAVDTPLSCTTITYGGTSITGIAPVTITEVAAVAGVSPASDSITIRYGSPTSTGAAAGATAGVPTTIGVVTNNGTTAAVLSNLGCQVGDITMVNTTTTCAMSRVTAKAGSTSITVENSTGIVPGASLACLGTWNEITYQVNAATGNLDRTSLVTGAANGVAITTPSVVGVVNVQAQYGVSTAASSNQIASWVDASGATWAAPSVANRNRIKAIRVAVVARNAKIEPDVVTTAAPTAWASTVTFDGAVWPAPTIDLSPGNANWARYRYRVFETTVPLRNVIWSKGTL